MDQPLASPPAGPDRPQEMPATLLVVDDNDLIRELLMVFFGQRGYTVLEAENGPEALAMVASHAVDLVLLDVMMPEVSGLDVLQELRLLREPSDLPIIMITAKDRTDDVVGALNMGANDYIVKPLDLPEVVARVKTQLQLKRAVSDLQQAKDEITLLKDDLEKRNQLIQRTFGQYLSAEVVTTILAQPPGVLRGEKRMVTLLMSDLRGFTTLAERHSPEQVVALLNNYLGGMADVITRYQGIIDEFIGDAIMALFGAPVGREDDAERAAACAVAMQIAMADVNEKNRRDGLPEVEMGVAVHTGEVVVGSIGSETRAKYGVVGTNVNLTSRIQSFTLGGQVLVSDATWRAAPDTIQVDQAPPLHARGFPEPIRVHDLTGVAGRHDLKLPPVPEVLRPLRRPIAVSFSVLQGKQRTPVESEGRMVQASDKWALVLCDPAPPAMTNLSVRVRHPDGAEVPGEVYAKVVGPAPGGVRIRFTSYAPEIALLLQETIVPGDATA